jgi:hypothetical protein
MAIDQHSAKVVRELSCPGIRADLTTMRGMLLQIAGEQCDLLMLDPESGRTEGVLPNPRPGLVPSGVEASRHGLWLGYLDLEIIELRSTIDLRLLDTFHVRRGITGIASSDHYVFYATRQDGLITLFDRRQRRETVSIAVNGTPRGIAWDGIRIWYCDESTRSVKAIELPGVVRS